MRPSRVSEVARGHQHSAPCVGRPRTQLRGDAEQPVPLGGRSDRVKDPTSIEVGLAYENDTFTYCFTTEDSQEGRAAFRDKRTPDFKGR